MYIDDLDIMINLSEFSYEDDYPDPNLKLEVYY
jgi:hypothetical protein